MGNVGFDHVERREFMTLLGGAAASWPLAVHAQQSAMPVIGVLSPLSAAGAARNIAALRRGLRDLGYVEGRNIAIEYRFARGMSEDFAKLAAELALRPAVIVVGSVPATLVARKVTSTLPFAMGIAEDPVGLGLAESFAHPGGNVTGFVLSADSGILGKKLELLRDAMPGVARVGIVLDPGVTSDAADLKVMPTMADRLGLQYRLFEVREPADLDRVFAAMASDDLQALCVSGSPIFTYIDKILRGEKPGELPLQMAEKYDLAVNLNTARALGLPNLGIVPAACR
jgi:putative tryptophan/tyrosine transport system substrate-binding protein